MLQWPRHGDSSQGFAQLSGDVFGDFGLVEEPVAGPGAELAEEGIGDVHVEDGGLAAGAEHAPDFGEGFHLEAVVQVVEEEGGEDAVERGVGIGQILGERGGEFESGAVARLFCGRLRSWLRRHPRRTRGGGRWPGSAS